MRTTYQFHFKANHFVVAGMYTTKTCKVNPHFFDKNEYIINITNTGVHLKTAFLINSAFKV